LGLKINLKGRLETLNERGNFIISRHLSYLDGIVLGGLLPAIFVSKKEIKNWPVIGWVVAISGTIFVDRINKTKIFDSVQEIAQTLEKKLNVLVFPEGTSTDGSSLKSFQTVFFKAPVVARAGIVLITIAYQYLDDIQFDWRNRDEICWYGGMNFFKHLWNLLKYKRIDADVTIHEKFLTASYEDNSLNRKNISQKCYDFIAEAAGLKTNSLQRSDAGNLKGFFRA
jgi:1-acyl-sn-glycerol-3-phosphate acyltransferase